MASCAVRCSIARMEDQRPSEEKPSIAAAMQKILAAWRLQRISERAFIFIDLDSEATTEHLLRAQ